MEEARETGDLTRIALAISILAVLVALVTVLGHGPQMEALLMQSRANDQWSEYQAKKIRQDNLMVVVDQMMLEPSAAARAKLAEYTFAATPRDRMTFKFINNDLDTNLSGRLSLAQYRFNPYQLGCQTYSAAVTTNGCGSVSVYPTATTERESHLEPRKLG